MDATRPASSTETRQSVPITNFGGNISFVAGHWYAPRNEAEVLELLNRHATGKVRVLGSLHSWSDVVVSADALVDLRHFNRVEITNGGNGEVWAKLAQDATFSGSWIFSIRRQMQPFPLWAASRSRPSQGLFLPALMAQESPVCPTTWRNCG